jgi:ketosteroid isomerase-like protein
MKYVIAIGLLMLGKSMHAQKNIDGLINAERSFAAYSVEHGTKEAFLKFLDSAGIVFDQGKPLNGIESWNKKSNGSGILNWRPQFAEISSSNDFGFTTGPWIFQASAKDTIAARGQYVTVWHSDKDGNWKFLVDLGIRNSPVNTSTGVTKMQPSKTKGRGLKSGEMLKAEKQFQELCRTDKRKAYQKYLSSQSIVNRNAQLPASTLTEQQKGIDATPTSIEYKIDGWKESDKLDMGYVYGTTVIDQKNENFLRIWRHEKDGWKIAVEVLRY